MSNFLSGCPIARAPVLFVCNETIQDQVKQLPLVTKDSSVVNGIVNAWKLDEPIADRCVVPRITRYCEIINSAFGDCMVPSGLAHGENAYADDQYPDVLIGQYVAISEKEKRSNCNMMYLMFNPSHTSKEVIRFTTQVLCNDTPFATLHAKNNGNGKKTGNDSGVEPTGAWSIVFIVILEEKSIWMGNDLTYEWRKSARNVFGRIKYGLMLAAKNNLKCMIARDYYDTANKHIELIRANACPVHFPPGNCIVFDKDDICLEKHVYSHVYFPQVILDNLALTPFDKIVELIVKEGFY